LKKWFSGISTAFFLFGLVSYILASSPDGNPVPFEHSILDPNYSGGDCRGIGDFNRDGYPDVVAGGAKELAWYEYPTWAKHVIALPIQEFTTDMQVGDVDGDGDPDIIIPDGEHGKLCWFEDPAPRGNPATDPWRCHLIGHQGTWAHDVEVGDIDRDGKMDVVTRKGNSREPGITIVWMQKGPDSWTRIEILNAERGEGTALADLNRDGRLDLVQNGYWLECPPEPATGVWLKHSIATGWPDMVGVNVADMNGDGRPDVLLAPAESHGRLVWYEAPAGVARSQWTEHVIDDDVDFVHTFKVADMNQDGRLDVVTAEMHASGYHPEIHSRARVSVYVNGGDSLHWTHEVLATTGSHNLRVGDIGNDGALDIVGANWGGPYHPLELWRNLSTAGNPLSLDRWTIIQVDTHRAKWGDFEKPEWMKYFGLSMGDVTGDGYRDIVSGRYFYRNPGGDMTDAWDRVDLGMNVDAILLLDVDGDGQLDAIGERLPDVYWLKPLDPQGNAWKALRIGSVPAASHVNGQGYALAKLAPGGKPQIVIATGGGIYAFQIPTHPEEGNWPQTRLAADATDEGFAVGDVDGDGLPDIAAGFGKEGKQVAWWKNPGNGQADWQKFPVGETVEWKDRTGIADVNGDGRPDIIVTEESVWKGDSIYVFEQPSDPRRPDWPRHTVVTQFTTNSMDVADMNRDGRPDVVAAEHRGTKKLEIWENTGFDWTEHIVSTGIENHLGARVADMDGDGDLDIIGIAWDNYPYLCLWRNDASFKLGGARAAAAPSIEPNGGDSAQPFVVSLATQTPGAMIRYTLDGSDPTSSSAHYAQPLTLTGSATLKARAYKSGLSDSEVSSAVFKTSYHY
jgi:Chitobiase/beta-hexosaminidase C-terminal domain/FG-GAP-like repeat